MNLSQHKTLVVNDLLHVEGTIQELIRKYPASGPATSSVLDELLRLKLEVARSLDRLR